MRRIDYTGPQAPQYLNELLVFSGGICPFGLPNYRLVHGSTRLAPSGGRWVEWAPDLSISERKEDGENSPLRAITEIRMVPRYPLNKDKWILEKWCEPSAYGTPALWYSPITSGGTMLFVPETGKYIGSLGEYPYQGDYENIGYAFPNDGLTEAVLSNAVGRMQRGIESMPMTPRGRVLRATYQAEQLEAEQRAAYKNHCKDMLDELDWAFGGNPVIGPWTKKRHSKNYYAEKAGIREHTGIS